MVYKVTLGGMALGDLKIKPRDSQLTAHTTVQNYDSAEAVQDVSLLVQGKQVCARTFQIPPVSSLAVSLSWRTPKPGDYRVTLKAGSLGSLSGGAALPAIDLLACPEKRLHGSAGSWAERCP